jgi:hypothetical protein
MNKSAQTKRMARLAAALTLTLALALAPAFRAGALAGRDYAPPRLADNTPDFRGIWQARGTAYVDIEGHPAERGLAASKSIVIDPPDGKIPYLPRARKQRDENFRNRATADPGADCYQAGVPRALLRPTPFQIVQSAGNFAFVYTDNHSYRIVDPSTVPHDDGIDFFMGDSRGRWEGDTLVVDVTDLGDQTWLDRAGNFHSDQLHVVERYTMRDANAISYQARIEDPKTFARPWTIRTVLYRDLDPNARITEDECLEGSDGRWQHVPPDNEKALKRHDYKAELAAEAKALAAAGEK